MIRKRLEHQVDALDLAEKKAFYVVSLSSRTCVWKGMLTAAQLPEFFLDLRDPDFESALALVHQRFSTNTFPSWPLAHPYRVIAHNGEINTLRGNINWMRAREGLLSSPLFAEGDLQQLLPVIREGGSDTATFDNVLEFLIMSGRSLPHAMLMMIPEPWQNHESMDPARRAFYEYHSSLMEPWDGPAAMAFSDGTMIGAVLDRNGLRPSRYYVTKDDLVIMASEVGVLDIPAENIRCKERLHPGKVFLVDTSLGRIVDDQEIKSALAAAQPYQRWLAEHLIDIRDLPDAPHLPLPDHTTVLRRQRAFGYTEEDLRLLLAPMAQAGEEATGSMGTDTALAVLSAKPRLLFDYFKQLFAQVTNPPLDAIREELITSMASTIGPEGNLLDPKPESCRQIEVKYPVLSNEEVAKLRCVGDDDNATSIQPACPTPPAIGGFKTRTLPMLFDPTAGRARPREGDRRAVRRRQRRHQGRRQHPDPVRSRHGRHPRRHPEPAGDGRRAPPPGPRGRAHEVRAGGRGRRRARSAPLRAAHRLRRRRRQPVPGVRDLRRHDPARHAAGPDPRRRPSPTTSRRSTRASSR